MEQHLPEVEYKKPAELLAQADQYQKMPNK